MWISGTNTLFKRPADFNPMTGTCSRCGRVDEMEHGSDGLPYCSACIFYGMNKQCYRCRMYLPATELQQYRGQLMCPYCIQDARDQDRKEEEYVDHGNHKTEVITYVEQCERCGRDLQHRAYIWNGRRLCKKCLDDAKDSWELARGGPMGPMQRIKVDTRKPSEKPSFIESMIGEFLMLAGLKKRPVGEIIIYHPKMQGEIIAAKPMSEVAVKKKDKQQNIEIEGIMTKDSGVKSETKTSFANVVSVNAETSKEQPENEDIVAIEPQEHPAKPVPKKRRKKTNP